MGERIYTARVHRPDGTVERLQIETQGGQPVPRIEISGRSNEFEVTLQVFELADLQRNTQLDEYDYRLAN